jgi:hypothetical protein
MRAGLVIGFALASGFISGVAANDSASPPAYDAGNASTNGGMPTSLVIGYEGEGHVDASDEACRTFVIETVEWEKADVDKAVKDVCAYRKRHVEEYAALQAAYKEFALVLSEQTVRFDGTAATAHLAGMVRSCIDHKSELTTGGQDVGIDMIPNGIAAQCLRFGTEFLTAETMQLRGE